MYFLITFSIFLSIALTMPSEYFELEAPEEVGKCVAAHSKVYEICSDAWVAKLKNITEDNKEVLKSNPELLPHLTKKTVCCGFYEWERCALKAVSPTAGCHKILVEFLKVYKAKENPPNLSLNQLCVEIPKESKECL